MNQDNQDTFHPDVRSLLTWIASGLLIYLLVSGDWPQQWVPSSPVLMAVAGLLVGFGATYGNGCTSGHGICGISRGSARSIVATLTFMATAFVTVLVMRHVIGG